MNLKWLKTFILKHPAYLFLVISLALTIFVSLFFFNIVETRQDEKLSRTTEIVYRSIKSRVDIYERALLHISAYFLNHPNITREEYKNYIKALNVEDFFPEIQGFGFTKKIAHQELKKYEESVRKEGFKTFKVWPETPREYYFSIHFLEPFDWRNKRAFGFDMFTQEDRRETMLKAITESHAVISHQVTLVQETTKNTQPGFLVYLPLFDHKIKSSDRSLENLIGFIYAPFRSYDFFNNILENESRLKSYNISIYDGDSLDEKNLLYSNFKNSNHSDHYRTRSIKLLGHKWIIKTSYPTSSYFSFERSLPIIFLIFGCAFSSLVYLFLVSIKNHARDIELSLARFNALFTNLSEGLIFLSADGEVQLINNEANKILDLSPEENLSQRFNYYKDGFDFEFLDGTPLDLCHKPITKVLNGDKYTDYELIMIRKKDNSRIPISFSGTPILNKNRKIIFAVIMMKNITEKIENELRLKEAISSRDEFISISSHELKTPLTSLKLITQLFKKKIIKQPPTQDSIINFLDDTDNQITRLTRLVDDILDISRLRSNKFLLSKKDANFSEIVSNIFNQLKPQFLVAGYPEPTLICPKTIQGSWDPLRIEQVISNLLTNAIRYGKGKPVTVTVNESNYHVTLCVQDNGEGISEDKQELIFERFERVGNDSETMGLGLGLFLSQSIVKAHGGRIWVESEINKGSKFFVSLPKQESHKQHL